MKTLNFPPYVKDFILKTYVHCSCFFCISRVEGTQPPDWERLPFPGMIWGFTWTCHEAFSASSFPYLHSGSCNSSRNNRWELMTAWNRSPASVLGTHLLTGLRWCQHEVMCWALPLLLEWPHSEDGWVTGRGTQVNSNIPCDNCAELLCGKQVIAQYRLTLLSSPPPEQHLVLHNCLQDQWLFSNDCRLFRSVYVIVRVLLCISVLYVISACTCYTCLWNSGFNFQKLDGIWRSTECPQVVLHAGLGQALLTARVADAQPEFCALTAFWRALGEEKTTCLELFGWFLFLSLRCDWLLAGLSTFWRQCRLWKKLGLQVRKGNMKNHIHKGNVLAEPQHQK